MWKTSLIFFVSLISIFAKFIDGKLCEVQLRALGSSNTEDDKWSFKMLDSWSNFRANFSHGNTFDFGNFSECINIYHNSPIVGAVNGQYCLIQFYSTTNQTIPEGSDSTFYNYGWKNQNKRFSGAICIPSTCSPKLVENIAEELFDGTDLVLASDYNQSDFCKTGNYHKDATRAWIVFTSFTTVLVTLVVLQTSYDIFARNKRKEKPNTNFTIFSLYTNGLTLFNFGPGSSNDVVECIDGIKALSTLAIIGFHSSYHMKLFPLASPQEFSNWEVSFTSFLTFGCHYFVESFFVISGFLVARSILKDFNSGSFNLFRLYFLRFMRIAPSLSAMIIVNISLGYYLIRNSPYAFHKEWIQPCETYWVSALLFIQNYYNKDDMCMPSTWYLSVDFQMYIVSPLFVYLIYKYGKKGRTVIIAIITASMCYTFSVAYQKDFIPNELDIIGLRHDFFRYVYFPTHVRGSTFLTGLILGCFFEAPDYKRRIIQSKILKIIFWIVAVFLIGESFFAKPFFVMFGKMLPNHTNAYLIATHRNILAVGIAIAIYMCHFEMGGFINSILTSRFFKPFSKISLCIYLVHPMLQTFTTAWNQKPIEFNETALWRKFFIDLVSTIHLALLLYLLVEAPFTRMAKIIAELPKKKTYNVTQNVAVTSF